MDFIGAKNVFYNNEEQNYVFFNGVLIWSKEKFEFSKDFKTLTEFEDWQGIYDIEKGGIRV